MTLLVFAVVLIFGIALGWFFRGPHNEKPEPDPAYAAKTVMLDVMGKPELFVVHTVMRSGESTTVEMLDLTSYLRETRR